MDKSELGQLEVSCQMTRCKTYLAEMSSNLREPPDDGVKKIRLRRKRGPGHDTQQQPGLGLELYWESTMTISGQLAHSFPKQVIYQEQRSLKEQWPRSGHCREKFGS